MNHPEKSPEELIREAEAEILEPRHAFDMVIPGEIRWRKDISKDCQWLYALIRNLCRREGYCWATNDYLGKEMDVTPRAIQKYVLELEKSGVIRREIINFGMKNRRRIFLTTEFKKFIITNERSPQSRTDRRGDDEQTCAELKRSITEEKSPPPLHPPKDASKENLTEEEEDFLLKKEMERKSDEPIKCRSKWRKAVLKDFREKRSDEEKASKLLLERVLSHRAEAEKHDLKTFKGFKVYACDDRVEFCYPTGRQIVVPYSVSEEEWKNKVVW